MDQRSQYLIQVLDRIGLPLMLAIIGRSGAQDDSQEEAHKIANLLSKTVQLSIDMGNTSELSDHQDDSLRVALAGLASPLVASFFEQAGQVPSETDLKKASSALQAVMTFAENFEPSQEHTERLANLKANAAAGLDKLQVDIQYIDALVPIINVVNAFSFGQQEQKLVMDVSSRLTARAKDFVESASFGVDEHSRKSVELCILKSMAEIYSSCHQEQTVKILNATNQDVQLSMDALWQSFDQRVALLVEVCSNIVPGDTSAQEPVSFTVGGAENIESDNASAPAENESSSPPSADANPMSMFVKPASDKELSIDIKDSDQGASASDVSNESDQSEESEDSSSKGDGGASPMSFFTKKE